MQRGQQVAVNNQDMETGNGIEIAASQEGEKKIIDGPDAKTAEEEVAAAPVSTYKSIMGPKPDGKWYSGSSIWWRLKWALLRGVDRDVVAAQKEKSIIGGDIEEIHTHATHFDNKAEFLYTYLQIMTAAAASFVHGANDVANAVGPYASIFQIWQSGNIPGKESNVPLWVLAFGGVGIVVGLWTYGYHIMSNLGNKITLMSPSRGFSMELGSVITIVIATRLELPVSTTQCITGAIVGVGFCNGDWRAINWRMVAWIYLGWFITVPVAGLISGCLMGAITYVSNSGHFPAMIARLTQHSSHLTGAPDLLDLAFQRHWSFCENCWELCIGTIFVLF